ncbi:MAG: RagB/SusD family nutrient uptake outer membrane protein [Bacteroidales bacterium]|nr:RagB/SusD family nutrient uptake outer membrane protein [Bacteroidales bacterium]
MKTRIYSKILMFFIAMLMITACSEDFLTIDKTGGIPQDEYYETDEQALAAAISSYDILQALWAQDWKCMWMVKELPAGDINCGGGNAADQPPYQQLSKFEYGPSIEPIATIYETCFFGIYRANKVIEKIEGDSEAKKVVVAEAKVLRAYYYFELVTMFGDVPLVTIELKSGEYAQPPSPASAIWTQIETDLTEAIADLPLRSVMIARYGKDHAFRVTKGTAQALLGKAYLYQEKYAQAADQFDAVIQSKEYVLEKDFSQILKKETEFGKESLFEISYSTEQGNQWSNFVWGNGRRQENNIHWQLCGPRGDGYFEGGNTGLINGWGFAYPTKSIFDAYTAEDTIRRRASVMSEEELIAQGGDLRLEGALPYDCEGYIRLKYGTWQSETDLKAQPELNYGTNIRLIRMADVYLMAAEAHYFNNGNETAARAALDSITTRAKIAPIVSSGAQLLADIKHQRRVELAFEGHRFADLVRWGDAADALGSEGYLPKHALYPIPQKELDLNKNMVQSALWR